MSLSLIFKILATALFSMAVIGKLSGKQKVKFIQWGYGTTFMYVLAFVELTGAIGLWLCPSPHDKYAVLLLVVIMFIAWFTLFRNPSPDNKSSWIASTLAMAFLAGYYFTTFS